MYSIFVGFFFVVVVFCLLIVLANNTFFPQERIILAIKKYLLNNLVLSYVLTKTLNSHYDIIKVQRNKWPVTALQ